MDMNKEMGGLRRDAILRGLYQEYPQPLGNALLQSVVGADLRPNAHNIDRAVDYLADRGCVQVAERRPHRITRLTPSGVDAVESGAGFSPADRERRRLLRLRVLQSLDFGRPQPLTIPLIQRTLKEDDDLDLTVSSIKRALCYLQDSGMAENRSC